MSGVQPVDGAASVQVGDEAGVVEVFGLVLAHLRRVVDRHWIAS